MLNTDCSQYYHSFVYRITDTHTQPEFKVSLTDIQKNHVKPAKINSTNKKTDGEKHQGFLYPQTSLDRSMYYYMHSTSTHTTTGIRHELNN